MDRIDKTVFISYRRTNAAWALAVFQYLTQQGYDVFIDYNGIASGDFERVILDNIAARAHFLLLLTPSALEHCNEPNDWLRREIEAALASKRNIIPLMFEGFTFSTPAIDSALTANLATLKRYNGLNIYTDYFSEGMKRLCDAFLNTPIDTVLHPISTIGQNIATAQKDAAKRASAVTRDQLSAQASSERKRARRTPDAEAAEMAPKIKPKPEPERPPQKKAEPPEPERPATISRPKDKPERDTTEAIDDAKRKRQDAAADRILQAAKRRRLERAQKLARDRAARQPSAPDPPPSLKSFEPTLKSIAPSLKSFEPTPTLSTPKADEDSGFLSLLLLIGIVLAVNVGLFFLGRFWASLISQGSIFGIHSSTAVWGFSSALGFLMGGIYYGFADKDSDLRKGALFLWPGFLIGYRFLNHLSSEAQPSIWIAIVIIAGFLYTAVLHNE
jgi:hypothetical protein